MNQDNPYQMLKAAFETASLGVRADGPCTGQVVGLTPLSIQSGGLTLTGPDLLVNPELLARTVNVTLSNLAGSLSVTCSGCSGDCPGGTADLGVGSGGFTTAALALPSPLAVGDTVVMLPLGPEPTYYVLCKVVPI